MLNAEPMAVGLLSICFPKPRLLL